MKHEIKQIIIDTIYNIKERKTNKEIFNKYRRDTF